MPRPRLLALLFALALAGCALLVPQSAFADLAQGHPATSSGQEAPSYPPGNAVDGNAATRFSSEYDDTAWWQVDLGSVQSVNEVNINWEAAYSSHYKIMVSTDGTNFTQAADVTNSGAGPKDTTFPAVNARYVRFQGVTRATQWGNSFYEFQVFGPSGGGGGGSTGPLPSGFRDITVWSGLTEPTAVRFAPFPDNRIFVTEKSGIIKEFDNLSDPTPTIVADLRTQVYNFWDRGLLGLAIDPQWPARPYVYISYAYDAAIGGTAPRWGTPGATSDPCPNPPGATTDGCVISSRLSKLTIDPATNQMTNEQVLINDWCQQYPSHSAGDVRFGPDGALYMSGGDGASFTFADYGQSGSPKNPCGDPPAGVGGTETLPTAEGGSLRTQDLRTTSDPAGLDGSVIRVNPDTGASLSDNPNAASADANARRIIAEGFRNPFRWTFRPGTSEMWIGDVGQNTWEEINRDTTLTSFKNYGWPCYEGNPQNSGFSSANICTGLVSSGTAQAPYFTYNHSNDITSADTGCTKSAGSSITGVAFYNGGNYPSQYANSLFFGDHTRGCIWVARAGTNGLPDMSTVSLFQNNNQVVDIETGPGGDIFYVNFEGGQVQRVQYTATPANTPPTAKITSDKTTGSTPLTVNFDGTGSSDPDAGDTLTYSWDLNGDGTFGDSTASKPSFTYTTAGNYTVKLRVTDSHGATDTAQTIISAGNTPPHAVIDTPASSFTYKVGDPVSFSGHGTDTEDGSEPASRMSWTVLQNHCPDACHTHDIGSFSGVASGSFNAPDHDYPSYITIQLKVTDAGGLSDTATLRIDPKTTTLNFASVPSGLSLNVNGISSVTPFSRTVIQNSQNSLTAPTPQTLSGTSYDWKSWSDSGLASHNVTAPSSTTAAGYTATYQAAAPDVNLALSKPATASSTESSSYSATRGNDGSTTTRWSSSFSNNQWWRVDLGSAQTVGKVTINWETAYASQYQIQTSNDASTWTTQATVNITSSGLKTTTFTPVSARYVRILGVTRATQWGISFWEAQVFSGGGSTPPPTQVELAKGQPASSSSNEDDVKLAPAFGNDGSQTTRWSSDWLDNQWWQVDLGSTKQVNQVTINWETAYASQYRIQTSTDGTTFTTQSTVNLTAPGTQSTTFPTVGARYVRLLGVTRATQWGFSFWEAQVFGPAP